jgi:APA family basic amino acid/polyamine antiporter
VTTLRRELGLLDATMINAGTMIASAIFIVPAIIAQHVGGTGPILLVWIVGGIVSLFGALAVAELGAAMPEAGGQYVYLSRAYSPLWGFLYGWATFAVVNTASIAAIAVGFATYLGFFVPLDGFGIRAVAIASVVVLTAVNCFGVRLGATIQNIFTLLKIGALSALVALAFAPSGAGGLSPIWPGESVGRLAGPFGLAMIQVLWAYDGWIEITYTGSEVRDPGRTIPRSIVLSTMLVMTLYVAVNLAYLAVLSPGGVAASSLVASDAVQAVMGTAGAALVAGAILVSTFGANHGIVLTSARIPFAMAREGRFFAWAARVHPRFRTPVFALIAQGGVAIALTLSGTYEQLATYVVFASWLFYALSAAAVIRLRSTAPDLPRPYKTWGYPVTPILFIAFALWLVGVTIVEAPREATVGAGLVLTGVPVYWWFTRRSRTPSA